jgi:phospholipase C
MARAAKAMGGRVFRRVWAVAAASTLLALLPAAQSVAATPTISGFTPTQGAVGTTVKIAGSGFTGAKAVIFNLTRTRAFTVDSDAQITAVVPQGATNGKIKVKVGTAQARSHQRFTVIPVSHVVVIFQENHSFNDVLGKICADVASGVITRAGLNMGCDGVTTGKIADGSTIALTSEPDVVPPVTHSVAGQATAIAGGAMNGYSKIEGCESFNAYACYTQYWPPEDQSGSSIANETELAKSFAVADRTFELTAAPSWVGHMAIAAASLDGFIGQNPEFHPQPGLTQGNGSGCDSNQVAQWGSGSGQWVPSCIPDYDLDPVQYPYGGAFETTPVQHMPAIFDELTSANLPWRIYGGTGPVVPGNPVGGYIWAICPTFAQCLYTDEVQSFVPNGDILTDAAAGTLPAYSIVTPEAEYSQHNNDSMIAGDDWIGQIVTALENGPEWNSTAVFVTWDDCGCFYDHVNPLQYNPTWGIRVPVIIAGPYVRAGFTDSNPTSFAGILAYVEHTFGLPAMNANDAAAYDFADTFDYSQTPLAPVHMLRERVPKASLDYIAAHPPDLNDPT